MLIRTLLLPCPLVVLTLILALRPAVAALELDITEGVVEPLPIAITELYGDTPEAADLGREIADVVSADLES
ncbi:MAG: Tol-Pal system protein TolB, partial [Geminicoccaceae bacterium]